jgi:hypothetical protein
MVLGDGCIRLQKDPRHPGPLPTASLAIKHSIAQKEYVEHKAKLLQHYLGGKLPRPYIAPNGKNLGALITKSNKYFRILHKRLYRGGQKTITREVLNHLTDEGLALWWMDDGSLYMKRHNGKVHAREGILSVYRPREECEIVRDWFKDRYDVYAPVVRHQKYWRVRFNSHSLCDLIPIIHPYIIPSMRYKVDMQYKYKAYRARVPSASLAGEAVI